MNFSLPEFLMFMVRFLSDFSKKYYGPKGHTKAEWIALLVSQLEKEIY